MSIIFIAILLPLNFVISWFNANSVGKIWSESKQIGGGTRVLAVSGYIMAIAGFTMVYSIILMFLISAIGPSAGFLTVESANQLIGIVSDLSYVLIVLAVLPTGIIITVNSLINFWKRKSLRNGGIAAWNTFSSVSNVISASRNLPSAVSRLAGSMKNTRGNGAIIVLAVIVVLCAILGGYFTASAIMKRADKKYDLFEATHTNLSGGGYNASMNPGQQYMNQGAANMYQNQHNYNQGRPR